VPLLPIDPALAALLEYATTLAAGAPNGRARRWLELTPGLFGGARAETLSYGACWK
jgi:hypothetical protein